MKLAGNSRLSRWALVVCFGFICLISLNDRRWTWQGAGGVLTYDVMGYYLYLPAHFIYKDIKQLSFRDKIMDTYYPSGDFYQAFRHPSGNFVMKYSIGQAIMYGPFFFVADWYTQFGDYPRDGFSLPYQMAISLGSLLVVFIGLWFLRKILSPYFEDWMVALVLILMVFGTNYFNYTAFDYAAPHQYLFTLTAILIFLCQRFYKAPKFPDAFFIGLVIGLASLIRPTLIVLAILPVLWDIRSIRQRLEFLKVHRTKIMVAVAATMAVGSIQLLYWKYVSGHWLVYSYEDQGFNWLGPHFHAVWFSYRKGWFIYTPMMLFAILGFFPLFEKKYRSIAWALTALFLVHMWIVAAWNIWWYGGGFGQRAMIDIYPALAFPMAAFFSIAGKFKPLKYFLFIPCLFFIVLNIFQSRQKGFETEAMTRAYYWRIFLNPEITPHDKFLLDTDEDFTGKPQNPRLVKEENFEAQGGLEGISDTIGYQSRHSAFSSPETPYSRAVRIGANQIPKSAQWIRATAMFKSPKQQDNYWWMNQFSIAFTQKGQIVKERMIRPGRLLADSSWQEIYFDTRIPEMNFDSVRVYLWNGNGDKTLYMDQVKLETFE